MLSLVTSILFPISRHRATLAATSSHFGSCRSLELFYHHCVRFYTLPARSKDLGGFTMLPSSSQYVYFVFRCLETRFRGAPSTFATLAMELQLHCGCSCSDQPPAVPILRSNLGRPLLIQRPQNPNTLSAAYFAKETL